LGPGGRGDRSPARPVRGGADARQHAFAPEAWRGGRRGPRLGLSPRPSARAARWRGRRGAFAHSRSTGGRAFRVPVWPKSHGGIAASSGKLVWIFLPAPCGAVREGHMWSRRAVLAGASAFPFAARAGDNPAGLIAEIENRAGGRLGVAVLDTAT